MKRTGFLVLMLGAMVNLGACGGDDDDDMNTTPAEDPSSVSAVIPTRAYLGRTLEVTISGDDTTWGDGAAVDFGDGITVDSVRVGSATGLVATITIAADAAEGAHDVTVTQGGATVTFAGAFIVEAPLAVDVIAGTEAQGSIVFASVRQKDLSTPFDLTQTGDGLFTPLTFPNIVVEMAGGLAELLGRPAVYSLDFLGYIDVDAATGPAEVSVVSGPAEATTTSSAIGFEIEARAPTMLTVDTDAGGNVTKPLQSFLYSLTPAAGKIVSVESSAGGDPDAAPGVAILPASGKWADQLNVGFQPTARFLSDGTTYYAIYADLNGMSGYAHTVEFSEEDPPETNDAANDACAMSQAVGLPFTEQDWALTSATDVDWVSFTVAAGDVGKVIHVTTTPGDEQTDTVVQIFGPGCGTAFGMASDADYHEDVTSAPIVTAGTYHVKVSHSTFPYAGTFYTLTISLEDPT